jgi:hypothetical protein
VEAVEIDSGAEILIVDDGAAGRNRLLGSVAVRPVYVALFCIS